MRLIAIDPAYADPSNRLGIARFEDGELVYCGSSLDGHAADTVIVELPQVYLHGNTVGDPAILINLAFVAGRIVQCVPHVKTVTVEPREWKGQVPKDIHNSRTLRNMTPRELDILEACAVPKAYHHNVIDAIGLGIWYLEKCDRRIAV